MSCSRSRRSGRRCGYFKLSTGTFVRVGALRIALLPAIPLLSDAVITGEGRDEVCAMAWLNPGEITDKGYINQRQVLANRPELVGLLYQDPPPAYVIIASSTAGVGR